jgi:putative ABC transport system permease protein
MSQLLRAVWQRYRQRPLGAVLTFAALVLGVAVSAVLFAVVDALILQPPPFRDPDRLFALWWAGRPGEPGYRVTPSEVRALTDLPGVESVTAYPVGFAGLFDPHERAALDLRDVYVDTQFFRTLGVTPAAGRVPESADALDELTSGVLLSESLWRQQFGADPHVVGAIVELANRRLRVIGVMPARFNFPSGANVWILQAPRPRGIRGSVGIVRLHSSEPAARVAIEARSGLRLVPIREFLGPETAHLKPVLALLVTAVVVLLVACVHLGTARMVQAGARRHELAVRMALGAQPRRLAAEELIDMACVVGVSLLGAFLLLPMVESVTLGFFPPWITAGRELSPGPRTMVLLASVTFAFGLAASIGPIRWTRRLNVAATLHDVALRTTTGGSRSRAILALQVLLVAALLYSTGTMGHELMRLRSADLGYRPERLLIVDLSRAPGAVAGRVWGESAVERLRQLHGIAAAAMGFPPDTRSMLPVPVGRDAPASEHNALRQWVGDGYFHTLGTRVVAGREFEPTDPTDHVMLSETLARTIGAAADVVGTYVWVEGARRLVVGIAEDIRPGGVDLEERRYVYFRGAPPQLVVRVADGHDLDAVSREISAATAAVIGSIADVRVRRLSRSLDESLTAESTRLALVTLNTLAALLVATLGLFAIVHDVLRQRLHEAAIRKALGASGPRLTVQVLWPVLAACLAGGVLGLVCGSVVSRWLVVTRMAPAGLDPLAGALALGTVVLIAGIAVLQASRRIVRLDPAMLLRAQ